MTITFVHNFTVIYDQFEKYKKKKGQIIDYGMSHEKPLEIRASTMFHFL